MKFALYVLVALLLPVVNGDGAYMGAIREDDGNQEKEERMGDLLIGPCNVQCGHGVRPVYLTKLCPNNEERCFLMYQKCHKDCGQVPTEQPKSEPAVTKKYSPVLIACAASTAALFILVVLMRLYIRRRKARARRPNKQDVEAAMAAVKKAADHDKLEIVNEHH